VTESHLHAVIALLAYRLRRATAPARNIKESRPEIGRRFVTGKVSLLHNFVFDDT
jgi:hypothetical protein